MDPQPDAHLPGCAQGESQEAAQCCEKSELQALAVKCVGAWEVRRILRCGAELQPPARHTVILRVRRPWPSGQCACGILTSTSGVDKQQSHFVCAAVQGGCACPWSACIALGVDVSALAHRGKGRSMRGALTSAWRCLCTQVRLCAVLRQLSECDSVLHSCRVTFVSDSAGLHFMGILF